MQAYEEKYFKILIVDESVPFRNNLATRLRLEGFNVEFATGGFHVMHTLEKSRDFSLVIIHEDMLDMSGKEIIMMIRNTKDKTDLPILFISENKKEEEICDMIYNGANEYIVKAVNIQPIVERAKKYFTLLKNS